MVTTKYKPFKLKKKKGKRKRKRKAKANILTHKRRIIKKTHIFIAKAKWY